MKQTAVDWLVAQLNKQNFAQVVTDEEIKQAKEMEKEQIELSHLNGQSEWYIKALEDINKKLAKEYYQETYGE